MMQSVNPFNAPTTTPAHTSPASTSPRRKVGLALAIALWALFGLAGVLKLTHYNLTPTASAVNSRSDWPIDAGIARPLDRPSLLIFAHPLCPCSRASLAELSDLLDRQRGRLKPIIVFVEPDLLGNDPTTNPLWQQAMNLPDASVMIDATGAVVRHFGALSSGQTYFYDVNGTLRFSGGVTVARGHRGDNAGIAAIRNLLSNADVSNTDLTSASKPLVIRTPVFGCALE